MIHIDNISFSYTGEAPYLLENLSLDVKDGDYISIVGSNGSGKSTLLKLILGFIKPSSGICPASRPGRPGFPHHRQRSDTVLRKTSSFKKCVCPPHSCPHRYGRF